MPAYLPRQLTFKQLNMPYVLSVIMAFSIVLPAFTGLYRYRYLQPDDRLFVMILCLGVLNETASLTAVYVAGTNAVTFNCYILAESILLLVMFYRWGIRESSRKAIFAGSTLVVVWLIDNVYNNNIQNFYGAFGLYSSLVMMYYSIRYISRCIVFDNGNLLRNGRCMACIGLLLYFSIKIITDTFFIIDLGISRELEGQILFNISIMNVVANIIYFYAFLCLKQKAEFTLEYL